jgi:hypothetical protein
LKNTFGELTLLDSKTFSDAAVTKARLVISQWNKRGSPEENPTHLQAIDFQPRF